MPTSTPLATVTVTVTGPAGKKPSFAYAVTPTQPTKNPAGSVVMTSTGTVQYLMLSSPVDVWVFKGLDLNPGDEKDIKNITISNGGLTLTLTDTYTNKDKTFGFRLKVKDGKGDTYESGDPEVINKIKPPVA